MTLATLKGRVQTKLLTYLLLAAITVPFWTMGGAVYLHLFITALVVGLILETIWGIVICHQPGWLTFIFAAVEFVVIALLATAIGIQASLPGALLYYLVSWSIIQLFLIYLLPVLISDWIDNGRELW